MVQLMKQNLFLRFRRRTGVDLILCYQFSSLFATESRLKNEPAPVTELNFTPALPSLKKRNLFSVIKSDKWIVFINRY